MSGRADAAALDALADARHAIGDYENSLRSREEAHAAYLEAGDRAGAAATAVKLANTGFVVRLAGGRVLTARRILVATGVRDELPEIPGVRERWGRHLLHCPYTHLEPQATATTA